MINRRSKEEPFHPALRRCYQLHVHTLKLLSSVFFLLPYERIADANPSENRKKP
jgi:hypothetical protein